jgi:hypothetical protein
LSSAPAHHPENTGKKRGLLRSSALVGLFTMVSRVLGLVRDVVFAWFIGASGGADAFFVAFKIPNYQKGPLPRRLCLYCRNTGKKAMWRWCAI